MDMATIPNRPDEITSGWVTQLLGVRHPGTAVDRVAVETIGGGFLGTVARIAIDTADPGAPTSLIAKFAHPDPATRAEVWDADIYQCESRFYRDLQHHIPLATPAAWFVQTDRDTDRHLIVIDDLSDAMLYDQVDGCPPARAFEIIEDLALLHRAFWGGGGALADQLRIAAEDESWFAMSAGGIPAMLEREDLNSAQRRLSEIYADVGPEAVRRLDRNRTVMHSDARIENVFFRPDGGRVWIDWDGIQLGGAGTDLAYFISQSLTVEVRREIEADLLVRYVDVVGRSDFTIDDAWLDYRRGIVAGWGIGLAVVGVYGAKDEAAARVVSAGITRVGAALDDHDVLEEFG